MPRNGSRCECLEGLANADVILVAPLIQIELFPLHRFEPGARNRRSRPGGGLQRQFSSREAAFSCTSIVRTLPPEPVRSPLRVRGLNLFLGEREGAARRTLQAREVASNWRTICASGCQAEQRPRIALDGSLGGREQFRDRQRAAARGIVRAARISPTICSVAQ